MLRENAWAWKGNLCYARAVKARHPQFRSLRHEQQLSSCFFTILLPKGKGVWEPWKMRGKRCRMEHCREQILNGQAETELSKNINKQWTEIRNKAKPKIYGFIDAKGRRG